MCPHSASSVKSIERNDKGVLLSLVRACDMSPSQFDPDIS